ncbi:hypothetical protein LS74_009345 [Helicobacter magdeburgensis]|uniref:Uncharacterized protein n=1 Tax=Helicobacter magdeburgensis TaxID=471858 RepID=A0A4U8SWI7_9HELI|nr:hypothetical protein [Helicobacter magdeburgensis]TLD91304.1 hypothetical protein LS74_009345 [Helicobacter magdeburgensis]
MKLNRFWSVIWWLCVMGFIIQNGLKDNILKGFDIFAIVFVFGLIIIYEIFFNFERRGIVFGLIMVGIPALILFLISYNFIH